MSLRALAIELYKAQQKVDGLEKELENPASHDKEKIKEELRLAKAEWKVIKKMLDGEKSHPQKGSIPSAYEKVGW